jgi:hypothetical protein
LISALVIVTGSPEWQTHIKRFAALSWFIQLKSIDKTLLLPINGRERQDFYSMAEEVDRGKEAT